MKNAIEELNELIRDRFAEARAVLDPPDDPQGPWWLDVTLGEQEINIEWRPGRGFGISARADAVFGERSDEVAESLEAAFERVKQLLLSGAKTVAPREMSLAELRRSREISQEELARRLAIRQASVSKMERRDDLLIGTLREMVSALGGSLEVWALFDDETIRITFEKASGDDHRAAKAASSLRPHGDRASYSETKRNRAERRA